MRQWLTSMLKSIGIERHGGIHLWEDFGRGELRLEVDNMGKAVVVEMNETGR